MAVQVSRSRHGYLALRIFWRGRDQWVGTKLRDDGEAGKNRQRLEAKAILVSERLEAGDELHAALLTVLGDCPPRLMPDKPAAETKPITLGDFAEWWLTHIAERERRNYWRKATSYVRNIILPILGKKTPLAEITTAKVKKLQDDLLRRRVRRTDRETGKRSIRTIKVKTVRNIVTSYFRSLLVEAMERHGVPAIDPFPANLRWPKEDTIVGVVASDEPDPFDAKERERILEWYRLNKPYWYPFLYFQFWTGCRPSETAGLREADVDLKEGTVRINKSRDEGEDNEPKTRGSKRMIKLYPNVVDVLVNSRAGRLHPKPDDFFFTGPEGSTLFVRDWPVDHGFYDTLRRLGIRQRVFYCTRDTSISWQLTQGANPWGVAKYHGTSLQMIERYYGKYIPDRGLDPAIIEALERRSSTQERAVSDAEAKVETPRNRNLDRNLHAEKAKVLSKSPKILTQLKCEEGDLNPQKRHWVKYGKYENLLVIH